MPTVLVRRSTSAVASAESLGVSTVECTCELSGASGAFIVGIATACVDGIGARTGVWAGLGAAALEAVGVVSGTVEHPEISSAVDAAKVATTCLVMAKLRLGGGKGSQACRRSDFRRSAEWWRYVRKSLMYEDYTSSEAPIFHSRRPKQTLSSQGNYGEVKASPRRFHTPLLGPRMIAQTAMQLR